MAESDTDLRIQFVEQCREAIDEIAETVGRCFGGEWSLSVSDPKVWDAEENVELLSCSGLCLTMMAGDAGYLMLFPASLPLPEWYLNPGDSEAARIATLPLELAECVLPEELRGGNSVCLTFDKLGSAFENSSTSDATFQIAFEVDGNEQPAKIVMLGPVENPPLEQPGQLDKPEPAAQASKADSPTPKSEQPAGQHAQSDFLRRSRLLMQLEVPVTVSLAEKKIELGQLLKLYPGALITFPKPCDDMLDMYVNNQLFARGEAVKIGEKFGLKINEIGAEVVRDSGVFTV